MDEFKRFRSWVESHWDVSLDLIRMYLGIGLFFKGIYFLMHIDELSQLMEGAGNLWLAPAVMAHYVIVAHIVGGFLLAIGLLTRAAAIVQIPILMGAVFYVHMSRFIVLGPRQNLEFAALVLFLLMLIFLYGPGRWSLDHYLGRKVPETARA